MTKSRLLDLAIDLSIGIHYVFADMTSSCGCRHVIHVLAPNGFGRLYKDLPYAAQKIRLRTLVPNQFIHAACSLGTLPRDVLVVENSTSRITTGRAAGLMVRGVIGERHHVDDDGEPALPRSGFDIKLDRMAEFHSLAS